MNRIIILICTCLIIGAFFLGRSTGVDKAENQCKKEVIVNQKKEVEDKDNIIIEKENVQIRKTISKSISSDNNLEWLLKNRCKDCQDK